MKVTVLFVALALTAATAGATTIACGADRSTAAQAACAPVAAHIAFEWKLGPNGYLYNDTERSGGEGYVFTEIWLDGVRAPWQHQDMVPPRYHLIFPWAHQPQHIEVILRPNTPQTPQVAFAMAAAEEDVPEPSTAVLAAIGGVLVVFGRRGTRRNRAMGR